MEQDFSLGRRSGRWCDTNGLDYTPVKEGVIMPINKVPRYKIIKCKTCGKTIRRFDRTKYPGHHVPAGEILAAIRRHYKRNHPGKFRESIRRGVAKREKAS